MADNARMAQIARQYYNVDTLIKSREKALKAELAKEIADREKYKKEIFEVTGKVSTLLGKIFFLFSETEKASVPKAVSDKWTEEQWAMFESLGGTREVTRTLKSVTERP